MNDASQLLLRGLCRGLHLAGYFCAFGTMFFSAWLLRQQAVRGLKPLMWGGFAVAFAAGLAWFVMQTLYFAGAQNMADILNAAPIVVQQTRFGTLLAGRMALLLLAALLFHRDAQHLAALLAGCGVIAEAWLGHGGAMTGREGDILLLAAILHLGAAAIWLGTLPALCLAIARVADPAPLARRYSPLGKSCVVLLLVTALLQYALLIGQPAALINSRYGALVLAKTILFAGLIGLAARNQLQLTPALPATRHALLRAIGWEIALGLLVLLAAGTLLQFGPPAMAGMAKAA